jgi:hypothetical protein
MRPPVSFSESPLSVIARSPCDDRVRRSSKSERRKQSSFLRCPLDCFAEPVIRCAFAHPGVTVTPISRPVVKGKTSFFGSASCQSHSFFSSSSRVRTAPVSSVDGCVRMADRARHPSGSSIGPSEASPWRHGRPRRTLVPHRIQKSFTEQWLPACRLQSPDGLRCGRSAVTAVGDGDPASNSVQVVEAPVTVRGSPDRRRPSGEAARYVERLLLLQDVITSARQLVR